LKVYVFLESCEPDEDLVLFCTFSVTGVMYDVI
jgi:hypothetical protein